MAKDYYSILGVSKESSSEDIKKAYKKLAKQFHPDLNKAANAEQKFKEINEAYAILGNEKKREQYDKFGTAEEGFQGFDPSSFSDFGFDFGDVFDQFFSGFGGGRRQRSRRGADLVFDVDITLEEAAKGGTKKVTLKKLDVCSECDGKGAKSDDAFGTCSECDGHGTVQVTKRTPFGVFATQSTCKACRGRGEVIEDPCKTCGGEGRLVRNKTLEIKIPPGIDDNMKLRVGGEGEAGERGSHPGDLYIVVHVKEHKYFTREENDLHLHAPVSFVTAALGGSINVPTIDGSEVPLDVPAGTSSGTVFTLSGKGMPNLNGYGKGSLKVEVYIDVPKSLTKKQKDLLRQFDTDAPKKKGWLFS